MYLPLTDIRVLDLTRALAGPYCTALLGDLGADVIKVESTGGGDHTRQWPPFDEDTSLYFTSTNRNKRSLAIDLYSSRGKAILRNLIETSDVFIENFRPGTLDKMGFSKETIEEINPEIIVASISGFGDRGPLRYAAGLDQVIQGMSGLMSVTGESSENPIRVGIPIIDITAGMISALGIVASLYSRAEGLKISTTSTSLLETGLALSVFQGQSALSLGTDPEPQGNDHPSIAPYGKFETLTTPITLAVSTDRHWSSLCEIIGMDMLPTDKRFLNGQSRLNNRDVLKEIIESRLTTQPADIWISEFREAGIPCGPLLSYTDALSTDQVKALQMVQYLPSEKDSDLRLLRGPINLNENHTPITLPPPELGEHTQEILCELGMTDQQINELEKANIVLSHQ